jgi:hypothetical protein
MTDYFEVITDASTGEQTIRPYTEEEIAAVEAANAPTREGQEAKRKAAYITEADPLFFMSQRGEATVEEWTAKVAEIKARYPYPEEV